MLFHTLLCISHEAYRSTFGKKGNMLYVRLQLWLQPQPSDSPGPFTCTNARMEEDYALRPVEAAYLQLLFFFSYLCQVQFVKVEFGIKWYTHCTPQNLGLQSWTFKSCATCRNSTEKRFLVSPHQRKRHLLSSTYHIVIKGIRAPTEIQWQPNQCDSYSFQVYVHIASRKQTRLMISF